MTGISKDSQSSRHTLGHRLVLRVVVQDESSEFGSEVLEATLSRQRHLAVANGIGHVAQAEPPSANTLFPSRNRQTISDLNIMVKCWGLLMVDEAPSLRFSISIFYLCSYIFYMA